MGPSEEDIHEITHSYGSGRKQSTIIRNVPSSSLIAVENDSDDNFCLFLAIELTLQHKKIQETENRHFRKTLQKRFDRLSTGGGHNAVMRKQISSALLKRIIDSGSNIAYDLPVYSVEEHVPIVQEYFYQLPELEERCRLIVFGEVSVA